jgi:pimeloyl-ACP methyl ester carboxylesterase
MINVISRRKRLFQLLGTGIVVVLLALYIGIPMIMAIAAVIPENRTAGEAPQGFRELTLNRHDGLRLAAWYAETQNGTVVILVHGAAGGRNSIRDYATMLYENGFGALALNVHGHDESEGDINRLGWNASPDIGAALDFLSQQDAVQKIAGLGLSMGGEILLGAASSYPEIKAIVAEGATLRGANDYLSLPSNRPLYRSFTHRVFSFMVGIVSGDTQPDPTLLQSIKAAESTSFLFIAAGTNETEIAYNSLFYEGAENRSQLWIIAEVGHTGGYSHNPQEYEQHLLDFFNAVLTEQ